MSDFDRLISAAEEDAAELEAIRDELAAEIAGLDEIEAEMDKLLARLTEEASA